ncbi:MAG: hypothetical protein GY729_10270 [Desulfobacteraceae bacterium]|nr:hypothetical protein [Desulfobacteraceae bacterium]
MGSNEEKRLYERYEIDFPAQLTVDKEEGTQVLKDLHTDNISTGGAFINTDQPLPVGTNVNVTLVLPLDELKKIKAYKVNVNISGQVIRQQKNGVVIGFDKTYLITRSLTEEKENHSYPPSLTPRETQILDLISHGYTNRQICDDLCVRLGTVKAHIYNLYKKIGVSNRFQAILWNSKHISSTS